MKPGRHEAQWGPVDEPVQEEQTPVDASQVIDLPLQLHGEQKEPFKELPVKPGAQVWQVAPTALSPQSKQEWSALHVECPLQTHGAEQAGREQVVVLLPTQPLPPCEGGGLLHVRLCTPKLQVAEQGP